MVAAVIPILLAGNQAYAAIELCDWKTPGDNLLVTDPDTGFQWLKLTQTNGMSYNEVTSDSSFSGFTLASAEQVTTFFADAGIAMIDTNFPGDYAPIVNLMDQWGILSVGVGPSYASMFRTTTAGPFALYNGIIWCTRDPNYGSSCAIPSWNAGPSTGWQPDDRHSYMGFALCRPEPSGVIPEPSTLIIWCLLAALGIGVAGWRRRRAG
jgi:hypothetical protein